MDNISRERRIFAEGFSEFPNIFSSIGLEPATSYPAFQPLYSIPGVFADHFQVMRESEKIVMRRFLITILLGIGYATSSFASEATRDEAIREAVWLEFTRYLNAVNDHRELKKIERYIHPRLFGEMDRAYDSLAKADPSLTREDLHTAIALDVGWRMRWILEHEVSLHDEYACIGLIFREYGELRHGIVVFTQYSERWVIEDSFINVRPEKDWEFEDFDGPHACHQAKWSSLGSHNKSLRFVPALRASTGRAKARC